MRKIAIIHSLCRSLLAYDTIKKAKPSSSKANRAAPPNTTRYKVELMIAIVSLPLFKSEGKDLRKEKERKNGDNNNILFYADIVMFFTVIEGLFIICGDACKSDPTNRVSLNIL